MMSEIPTLRWGIVGTGNISSIFAQELLFQRPDAQARHIIQAIGSSSAEKGCAFVEAHCKAQMPTVYSSYAECYHDPLVDIIYIGTPHAFHKRNCLDAIAAGKHVLCEKAFTVTAKEAREVLNAAKTKGVFVMEAMWTRHFPLVQKLRQVLYEEKLIGEVRRVFCDFSMNMGIAALGPESRLKNRALGAGSLLDLGIYSLTWAILGLEESHNKTIKMPKITANQILSDGVDVASSVLLQYADGKQGIVTSSTDSKTPWEFCRIEGTAGFVIIGGPASSVPVSFSVFSPELSGDDVEISSTPGHKSKKYEFNRLPRGFYYEADAAAVAIAAGEKECSVMPWSETIRVMEMMDEIRRQGGATFPQDYE